MPTTTTTEAVTTFAVVGGRGSVAGWFSERGLDMDLGRVAQTSEVRDGVRHITRYVAHDTIDASDAARYDHIVHV